MKNELQNQKEKITVYEEIASMKNEMRMGRFTLDFEGMDTMTILQRSEYVRHSLYEDRMRLSENASRLVNDITLECDRREYFPNVHLICEKMTASVEKRFEKAERALTSLHSSSNIRPGKKAVRVRRTIDAKLEAGVVRELSEERKRIDAQKREMERYIKMAPDSSYAAMITRILSQNEKSYQLASAYLSSKATVAKYEQYEKLGVLVEEKKLRILAKEKEQAAKLRLDNDKQSAYLLQERDALLKFDNKELVKQAHSGLLNCARNSLALIAIPREMTERLLEYGLMESEEKYYQALQVKQNLTGFHPFKRMALNWEIKKIEREYNEGLALLPNTPESKQKHPPLTSLAEWERRNTVPEEKIEENAEEMIEEIPAERIEERAELTRPTQLDLGAQIRAHRVVVEPIAEQATKKEIAEPEKEL